MSTWIVAVLGIRHGPPLLPPAGAQNTLGQRISRSQSKSILSAGRWTMVGSGLFISGNSGDVHFLPKVSRLAGARFVLVLGGQESYTGRAHAG